MFRSRRNDRRRAGEVSPPWFPGAGVLAFLAGMLACALCASARTAQAREYSWTERGYGGGGRFTAVAVNPADPSRVLVGSDVAGYFLSTDGGRTFAAKGAGLGGLAVASIVVDPEDPKRVFFLTDDGLYLSDDGGENVAKITSKVRYNSRTFGSRLLVRFNGSWYAATNSDGVFRLTPAGNGAWAAMPLFGLEGKQVNSLAVFRNRLIAATDEGVFAHDGQIWKNFSEGLPGKRDMTDLVAHPSGRLYAVDRLTGLYAYDEQQDKWERRGPNPASLPCQSGSQTFKALAVSPDNPDLVFLGTHPKSWPHLLLRSQDGGRTWALVKRFALAGATDNWATDVESVEQIVFSPERRAMYLTDWWNVWRSMDEGASWLQLQQGLQNTVVNDVQTRPDKPGVFYLATDDNGLMVSRDDGRTWQRKMQGVPDGNVKVVRLSAKNPDQVYMLVTPWKSQDTAEDKYFHLYKSADGGETWTAFRIRDRKKPLDKPYVDSSATNLVLDPAEDGVAYVGTNGYGVYRVDTRRQPGQDGDAEARNVSASLPTPYIKGPGALIVNPKNPRIMLVGTQEGGIFRTEDGGATWKPAAGGKAFIFGMAADPHNPDRVYAAAAEKRLLTSADGGASWRAVDLPGPRPGSIAANAVAVSPSEPGTVYVGTMAYDHKAADGLYVSKDYGATFVKAASTLPPANVNVIVPYERGGAAALVGFNGIGLYQLSGGSAPPGQ